MLAPGSTRLRRSLLAVAAVLGLLLPGAVPAAAVDPVVLKVGTIQDLDSMNPYLTALFSGYEVFALNYDLLVGYGPDEEPWPGFASKWTQDGTTWTFKIDPGLTWSDGTPATSEDARWTIQTLLDGQAKDGYVGLGYLDPYLTYAGVTAVSAPDPQTLVLETATPNTQILTSYIPILPKHVWEGRKVGEDANDPPVVGTGAYQAVEWKPGEYVRMVRNPYYWGDKGYADEVYIQFFKDEGAMVEAFKSGEIDYARNPTGDQWDSLQGLPDIVPVKSSSASEANGFTELGFNTYSKKIKGGGPSTKALQDPAFRDALGYAIDKQALVDRVLGGKGAVGTTHIPPALGGGKWHIEPTNPRTFDIELAKQKLEAAGYKLDANGKRLDKENRPIVLRMVTPQGASYTASAQFVADWWKRLGIGVNAQSYDDDTLTALMLPPEAKRKAKADFDVFIWGWGGDVDPNSLLNILTTDAIGSASDSFFSNPRYDELMKLQQAEEDPAQRKAYVDEMQQIMYDQAPYHILFYDEALHAYRTDHFGNWRLQPSADGLPFFGYGALDYNLLSAPQPEATPTPAASEGAPAASSSASPGTGGGTAGGGGDNSALLIGGAAVVLLLGAVVIVAMRRRGASEEEEE